MARGLSSMVMNPSAFVGYSEGRLLSAELPLLRNRAKSQPDLGTLLVIPRVFSARHSGGSDIVFG